jgi:hypothetical protein
MNKLIYIQTGITLSTGDTFVETSTITIPGLSGGLLIARISSVGDNTNGEFYVCEMVAGYNKDDNGVLSLLTTQFEFEDTSFSFSPRPSYVNNSNNLRIRFTRNAFGSDTNWIVDLDIYYIVN